MFLNEFDIKLENQRLVKFQQKLTCKSKECQADLYTLCYQKLKQKVRSFPYKLSSDMFYCGSFSKLFLAGGGVLTQVKKTCHISKSI
jgi:hypothetical protein